LDRADVARNKKKVAQDPGNVLLTSDEAGFNLLSSCLRTYAPRGRTPVVQQDCKYAHLSVIAAISTTGAIVSDMIDGNFDGEKIVGFLRKLLGSFRKEIHLVWDGAKCHMGQAVKDFLKSDPEAKRLFLYRIPPYSPELNPTEQLWNNVKNVELKNQFSKNKSELKEKLIKVFENIKEKTNVISAFFKHPKVAF
jgi:transposase